MMASMSLARAAFAQMDANTLCDRGIIIAGDPDSCLRGVQLYEEAGVDQVILIMQTETIPHEKAMQSIELKVGQSSVKIDQMGVTIKGMMIKVEGTIQTDVKGLMTNVKGDAMLMVKGGITMIN